MSSLSSPVDPRLPVPCCIIPNPIKPSFLRSFLLKLFIGDHVPNFGELAVGLCAIAGEGKYPVGLAFGVLGTLDVERGDEVQVELEPGLKKNGGWGD